MSVVGELLENGKSLSSAISPSFSTLIEKSTKSGTQHLGCTKTKQARKSCHKELSP